jgi:hypothetical protein
MDGNPKTFGGDSWRVYIRQGPASLAPVVIDHDNGLYEILVIIVEPGDYYAGIYLDYTLCNGYRDPPKKFFRNGKCCCSSIHRNSVQSFSMHIYIIL